MNRVGALIVAGGVIALAGCETLTGQKSEVTERAASPAARVEEPSAPASKGSVLPALLRGDIGKLLTVPDQLALTRTTQTTLETVPIGTQGSWRNPESGSNGTVIPTRTYQKSNGAYCREFTQRIEIRGRSQEAVGTACRELDGTWTLVEG